MRLTEVRTLAVIPELAADNQQCNLDALKMILEVTKVVTQLKMMINGSFILPMVKISQDNH